MRYFFAHRGSIPAKIRSFFFLRPQNAEEDYVERLMPIKLAMDLFYIDHFSIMYDIELIFRTAGIILCQLVGKTEFKYPKEYQFLDQYIAQEDERLSV